ASEARGSGAGGEEGDARGARRNPQDDRQGAWRFAMTTLAHVAGWTLIHFVWQGAAIGIVVWTAFRGARRQSANVRYLLACAGLIAMITVPAITARTLWLDRTDLDRTNNVGAELARPEPLRAEQSLRAEQARVWA